jgi:hypothetical protein
VKGLFELFQLGSYNIGAVRSVIVQIIVVLMVVLCLVEGAGRHYLGYNRLIECAFLFEARLVVLRFLSLIVRVIKDH